MSNKLNKIWLKWLNPHIYQVDGSNWFKIFKKDQFQFSLKVEGQKTYLTFFVIIVLNLLDIYKLK